MAYYAHVKWSVDDVLTIAPKWSQEVAENFLQVNESLLQDRMIELGWQIMEQLIPKEAKGLDDGSEQL